MVVNPDTWHLPPCPLLCLLCSAPIRTVSLFFLLFLLCNHVSASNSNLGLLQVPSTSETWNRLVPPRRYLGIFGKISHRRSAASRLSSLSSSSSRMTSNINPQSNTRNPQKNATLFLFFAELLAGMISGVALGAVVTVCFATALNPDEEEIPRLVFGYTVLDPNIVWAPELSSFFREEKELPSMEMIGRGGSGTVYKVEVPNSNGVLVALKWIDHQPSVSTAQLCKRGRHLLDTVTRQLQSEIMTAGFLRHPNIAPLLAHVYRNDRHYLIYEYMKNGSLQDALMRRRGPTAEGTRAVLDWPTRFKIARGIASGLEYLHIVHRPAVLHRDLKPANILLDDNMNARISDFGLAKEASHLDDDGLTTSHIAGTIGYIAPEYYQVMRYTDKCDVYSFGLILAVLVTGRFPTDKFFNTSTEEMCLVGWLRNGMRSENPAAAMVDEKLLGNGFESQMILALKISCFCTYDNTRHRPSMRDVRCMLSQIKH